MLNLQFKPFKTQIIQGCIDLSSILKEAPDEEFVLIKTDDPIVFQVADHDGFLRMTGRLEKQRKTGWGHLKLLYDRSRLISLQEIGEAILDCVSFDFAEAISVYIEPLRDSIRITVLSGKDKQHKGEKTECPL